MNEPLAGSPFYVACRPASSDAVDEWTQLVGIPPEVPTASPSQLADPDSDLGQAAAAAGRLYYVDLVPRAASRNSLDSPESGPQCLCWVLLAGDVVQSPVNETLQ